MESFLFLRLASFGDEARNGRSRAREGVRQQELNVIEVPRLADVPEHSCVTGRFSILCENESANMWLLDEQLSWPGHFLECFHQPLEGHSEAYAVD